MNEDKDKMNLAELQHLRNENEQLKKANSALSYAYMKLVSEYSLMLNSIEKHSENIKHIIESLNSPKSDTK